jgi:hypothetical protein
LLGAKPFGLHVSSVHAGVDAPVFTHVAEQFVPGEHTCPARQLFGLGLPVFAFQKQRKPACTTQSPEAAQHSYPAAHEPPAAVHAVMQPL